MFNNNINKKTMELINKIELYGQYNSKIVKKSYRNMKFAGLYVILSDKEFEEYQDVFFYIPATECSIDYNQADQYQKDDIIKIKCSNIIQNQYKTQIIFSIKELEKELLNKYNNTHKPNTLKNLFIED